MKKCQGDCHRKIKEYYILPNKIILCYDCWKRLLDAEYARERALRESKTNSSEFRTNGRIPFLRAAKYYDEYEAAAYERKEMIEKEQALRRAKEEEERRKEKEKAAQLAILKHIDKINNGQYSYEDDFSFVENNIDSITNKRALLDLAEKSNRKGVLVKLFELQSTPIFLSLFNNQNDAVVIPLFAQLLESQEPIIIDRFNNLDKTRLLNIKSYALFSKIKQGNSINVGDFLEVFEYTYFGSAQLKTTSPIIDCVNLPRAILSKFASLTNNLQCLKKLLKEDVETRKSLISNPALPDEIINKLLNDRSTSVLQAIIDSETWSSYNKKIASSRIKELRKQNESSGISDAGHTKGNGGCFWVIVFIIIALLVFFFIFV